MELNQAYNNIIKLMFELILNNTNYLIRSLWWHAFGLQDYWVNKKLIHKALQCMLQYNNKGESIQMVDKARLKLKQFYVPFVALFICYVLALVQFLRERFVHY